MLTLAWTFTDVKRGEEKVISQFGNDKMHIFIYISIHFVIPEMDWCMCMHEYTYTNLSMHTFCKYQWEQIFSFPVL